jgi:hypothetical protein
MSKIVLDMPNSSAIDEIIALTKKLEGSVIDIENTSKKSPFIYLQKISKNGGISSIEDASVWQKETRTDKNLYNRD